MTLPETSIVFAVLRLRRRQPTFTDRLAQVQRATPRSIDSVTLKPYSDTGFPMTAALAAKIAQSLATETSSFERSLPVTEAPRSVSLSRI